MSSPEPAGREADPPGHPLDPLLRPRSVAVVGASSDPKKRGFQAVRALGESGFAGDVFPVNPRGGEILGRPVVRSVEELPPGVDLALVCTPADTVPGVVEACAAAGVGAAVVLAVGFGEAGDEGRELQEALRAAAGGVRVLGPNTSGLMNLPHGLNLIGARGVTTGDVALLVQSGNVALALMTEDATRAGRGFSLVVGVGNAVDVALHELLDFAGADPHTRAVVVHVEGLGDGAAFLEAAARASRTRPVVVLKGARSAAGGQAARSHTGAVAGEYEVLRAGLRQSGVVEVVRSDEVLAVARTLAGQPPARPGSGVAILSDGGGQGALAADAFAAAGVPLASVARDGRGRLRELLGRAATVANPVDLAGRADGDPGVFARALEVLAVEEGVGAVMVVGLFGGYHIRFSEEMEAAEVEAAGALARIARGAGVGLVVHSMYASRRSEPLAVLQREGVPVVESLDVACRCAGALVERGRWLARPRWRPAGAAGVGRPAPEDPAGAPESGGRSGAVHPSVAAARRDGRDALTEPEARVCADAEEAARAVESLGSAAVLKVVSPEIPHKSDAGGVVLGVRGAEDARRAFREVTERARRWLEERGGGRVEGVLVVPELPRPTAELLVGARRDPTVGPVVTVGAGGVLVEALSDVTHRVLPVDAAEADAMLEELRLSRLLSGYRGLPPVDRGAVVRAVEAVGRCLLETPAVAEVEVNPLFAGPGGAVAVDARVFLRPGEGSRASTPGPAGASPPEVDTRRPGA